MIIGAVNPVRQPGTVLQKQRKHWSTFLRLPLWLCLLLALIIRVLLIVHTNGVIDGDESLVGIQAQHILRGELPIYFYGIPYFGSLEAYFIAFVFAIAGSSVWALRAEPTLLSLVIVWLTWRLAGALADLAQLPLYARQRFMIVAALLAAVFPLYNTVLEIRTFGGYIETFVLMLLLLLSALQLTRRWRDGASKRELAWRWAGIGFIVGSGLWVDPLIISAIVVAALWIIGYCLAEIERLKWRTSTSLWQSTFSMLKGLLWALVAIPASIVGCAPAIYWGAMHRWENVSYILQLGNSMSTLPPVVRAQYPTRLSLISGLVKLYTTCVAPRIIGGALPSESGRLLTSIHAFALALGVMCILITVALVALSFIWHSPLLLQVRNLAFLPLLFGAATAFFFCTSTAAVSGLGCNRDLAGRYATPLMLALPFFLATVFTVISMSIREQGRKQAQNAGNLQDASHISPPGIPSHLRFSTLAQGALFAILLIYLCAQVSTYRLTDAGHTFQSPYCTHAPAINDPIIAYLQQQHIRYAWAPNWVGFPIVFKTNGAITLADPQPVMKNMAYFNRFPADVITVLHADRPSFLVMVPHGDRHPQLLKMFDASHVTYHAVYFPSEPETDVLVVTPLSRTVSPFESSAYFDIFHCSS